MANSTVTKSPDLLLKEENDAIAVLLIPVMVYMGVLMLVGLPGNSMVCVYYGCRARRSTNTIFITVLAVFDLITCSTTIPMEIAELRFFYTFQSVAACKIMRFFNHVASIGSMATLLAISVDRFKRICRPFKRQLTITQAKFACLLSVLLSLICSWPALVFFDSVKVNLTDPVHGSFLGHDCTTTKAEQYQSYLLAFNVFQLTAFFITAVSLTVLYFLIGHRIIEHRKSQSKYTPGRKSSVSSGSTNDRIAESSVANVAKPNSNEPLASGHAQPVGTTHGRVSGANQSPQLSLQVVKYTILMFVISAVFVLSFLPYLALVVWRVSVGGYEVDILSDSELVAYQIGLRSYMLNSAVNPLLYGFFNSRFRAFFRTVCCPCCRWRQESQEASFSS